MADKVSTERIDFVIPRPDEDVAGLTPDNSWTLVDADRDVFIHALLNPREPSEKLKAVFRHYKALTGKD